MKNVFWAKCSQERHMTGGEEGGVGQREELTAMQGVMWW